MFSSEEGGVTRSRLLREVTSALLVKTPGEAQPARDVSLERHLPAVHPGDDPSAFLSPRRWRNCPFPELLLSQRAVPRAVVMRRGVADSPRWLPSTVGDPWMQSRGLWDSSPLTDTGEAACPCSASLLQKIAGSLPGQALGDMEDPTAGGSRDSACSPSESSWVRWVALPRPVVTTVRSEQRPVTSG